MQKALLDQDLQRGTGNVFLDVLAMLFLKKTEANSSLLTLLLRITVSVSIFCNCGADRVAKQDAIAHSPWFHAMEML
jgi:hypothetical protein